jgi:hypothetical protein
LGINALKMEETNHKYNLLINSLKVMSMSYKEQKIFMTDFVVLPFEVIDDFENAFVLLPQLIDDDIFSTDEIADLLRIHLQIDQNCRNPELEDLDEKQFEEHPDWELLRTMARDVLSKIEKSEQA